MLDETGTHPINPFMGRKLSTINILFYRPATHLPPPEYFNSDNGIQGSVSERKPAKCGITHTDTCSKERERESENKSLFS